MVVSSIIRRFEASEWQWLQVEVEIEVEVEVVLSTVHPRLGTPKLLYHGIIAARVLRKQGSKHPDVPALPCEER